MKNRYARGSKLSEHKFLRLLQGYAAGMPIGALAPTTHVSDKTIRATYAQFRTALPLVITLAPDRFGAAAPLLSHEQSRHWLRAIRQSRVYQRHRRDHAPRLSCPLAEELLTAETAVRMLCALDLRSTDLRPEELFECLTQALPQIRARDPLQKIAAFVPGARPHAHPAHRLFEDYRRTLLKHPLNGTALSQETTGHRGVRACVRASELPSLAE